MKILLSVLLVILSLPPAQAQQVQEEVEQAIENWYSKTGRQPVTMNVTQFGQANPSKEFKDRYDPNQTYCVNCEITRILRKVRVVAPSGQPPEHVEVTPRQATTLSESHIVIITQSGEIELINDYTMAGNGVPPPPIFSEFRSLWRRICPFPIARTLRY